MIVETYQSKLVLETLRAGKTYGAKPNLTLRGQYEALIDLLGLSCECPIFGVVKGKKQNTGGKVSGSFKLTLEVPEGHYWLTEYEEWADFLYAFRFSRPGNYKSLQPDCEELTVRQYNEMMEGLKEQRPLAQYKCPQVVLEKIDPQWLKGWKAMTGDGPLSALFRKGS